MPKEGQATGTDENAQKKEIKTPQTPQKPLKKKIYYKDTLDESVGEHEIRIYKKITVPKKSVDQKDKNQKYQLRKNVRA